MTVSVGSSALLGLDEGSGDEVVGSGERLAQECPGRVEGEVDVDALAGVGEQQCGGAVRVGDAVDGGGTPAGVGLGGEEGAAGGGVAGDAFVVDERGGVAQGGGEAAQAGRIRSRGPGYGEGYVAGTPRGGGHAQA